MRGREGGGRRKKNKRKGGELVQRLNSQLHLQLEIAPALAAASAHFSRELWLGIASNLDKVR